MKSSTNNSNCLTRVVITTLSVFALLITAPFAQADSECGPVLQGAIANLSYECLNDSSMLLVQDNNFEWQYAHDSVLDGAEGNQLGTTFEMYGLAFKETPTEVYFVISGALPRAGDPHSAALNGSVSHGDIFFNLTSNDFKTASDASELHAIRYAPENDSGVAQIGVYKNVSAKTVAPVNRGFSSLRTYENKVVDLGSVPDYADFDRFQTYYASDLNLNVIDSGDYLGPIVELTPVELAAEGFDLGEFDADEMVAFKFAKQLIIDECGVLGGDGSTCVDCAGVACGDAQLDQCEVCNGDGTSCLDCLGVPFGTAVVDQCGVCDGDGTSCLDCAGIPFGTTVVDQCGVCGGTNECLDCEGTPFGGLEYDVCGVCDGDGTSCLDCAGTPNGDAVEDQCGVCEGDGTSCLDCLGNPDGDAVVDQCGVCDGDGTSCLDCAGTPNGDAELDECGVCEGDGLSCLECIETDNKSVLLSFDSKALEQRNAAWRATNVLSRLAKRKGRSRLANRAQRLNQAAGELYSESWNQTWQLPLVASDCGAATQCVSVSFVDTVTALNDNALQLRKIGRRAYRLARRISGKDRFRRGLRKVINSRYRQASALAEELPLSSSVCN